MQRDKLCFMNLCTLSDSNTHCTHKVASVGCTSYCFKDKIKSMHSSMTTPCRGLLVQFLVRSRFPTSSLCCRKGLLLDIGTKSRKTFFIRDTLWVKILEIRVHPPLNASSLIHFNNPLSISTVIRGSHTARGENNPALEQLANILPDFCVEGK